MNKKTFLLANVSTFALVIGAACLTSGQLSTFAITSATSYSLNLSRSVTADEVSAGHANFYTAAETAIAFNFESASIGSGLIDLANGGTFYNDTAIHGISAINVTLLSGTATLTYGNAKDALNLGSEDLSGTSLIAINLAELSDYFKIVATSALSISNISITYSCSNDYQYAADREAASGDLFYSSTLEQSFSWAYVHDRNCFDVVNSNSGYSFHLKVDSSATGWPSWNYNFGSAVGAESFDLQLSIKSIGHTDYNLMLLDGSNNNILNGNRAISATSEWQTITLSNLTVAAGKSLADVQKVKFSANFGSSAGSERHLYLDELHILIPESPSRSNLEMCEYTRASTSQTAAASVCYDETYGVGSTSSRKLDFASATGFNNSETSTWRAFATFNIEASLGASNGINAKNCTLSVDLKFSSVIVNSPDTNKGAMTVEITDGNGTTASYFQVNFTMKDGWIHASRNLSGVAALASLSGDTKTIKLGFYGVYTGNQASAVVIVDNLALTAN